ncbi:Hypothetical protein GSB_153146, partial [Giardia duodenalis]
VHTSIARLLTYTSSLSYSDVNYQEAEKCDNTR